MGCILRGPDTFQCGSVGTLVPINVNEMSNVALDRERHGLLDCNPVPLKRCCTTLHTVGVPGHLFRQSYTLNACPFHVCL